VTYIRRNGPFNKKSPHVGQMKTISLLAVNGCLSSTISTLIDAFSISNRWYCLGSGQDVNLIEIQVVSPDGKPVLCSDCIQIHPHRSFVDTYNSDYLIIPAFMPVPSSSVLDDPVILEYITNQHR
jgi:transcriptional regulator GlxA family with amidase domain